MSNYFNACEANKRSKEGLLNFTETKYAYILDPIFEAISEACSVGETESTHYFDPNIFENEETPIETICDIIINYMSHLDYEVSSTVTELGEIKFEIYWGED